MEGILLYFLPYSYCRATSPARAPILAPLLGCPVSRLMASASALCWHPSFSVHSITFGRYRWYRDSAHPFPSREVVGRMVVDKKRGILSPECREWELDNFVDWKGDVMKVISMKKFRESFPELVRNLDYRIKKNWITSSFWLRGTGTH